jgi:citrate lyase subunit beta/citryl-CoA lyase
MRPPDSPIRSCLFVPGNRLDRLDKALACGADEIVIDLEDSVPPDAKDAARSAVAGWLDVSRSVLVRINARGTPWHQDDIELVSRPGLRGFMLSKTEHLLTKFVDRCRTHGKVLVPLIETALGFHRIDVLSATPAVERLAFGSIDFQVDLGIHGDDDALGFFRSKLVLASRIAKLQAPLDGVTTEIRDPDAVRQDTQRAKRFGFGGKLCIHPNQVPVVNQIFTPSAEELAWAHAVIDAMRESGSGAVTVNGHMVDKPIFAKAEFILRSASR